VVPVTLASSESEDRILILERKTWELEGFIARSLLARIAALEQGLAASWFYAGQRRGTVRGTVNGCSSLPFPGATIRIRDHATLERIADLVANSSGVYEGPVNLESDPQNVDVIATAAGIYAARFGGPVSQTLNLNTGENLLPTLTLPPATGYYCPGGQYQPEATCIRTFVVRECGNVPLAGAVVELYQDGDLMATCTTTGGVASIAVGANGANYTTPPTVGLTGGVGSGAAATAIMRIGTVTRTSGGTGYTNGSYTDGTFSGGGGSGGTFSYTVSGGVVQSTITITNRGTGYTSVPTPVINAGPGAGATFDVKLQVGSVTVTARGSGYTGNPTVGFTGGSGSGATAAATVAINCTLDVPAGDYDVVIIPASGSGYATYTGTLTHTCPTGGTTTIDLEPDEDHLCYPGAACGPCRNYPLVMFFTPGAGSPPGSFPPGPLPSDTLNYDAGQGKWIGTPGLVDLTSPITHHPCTGHYVASCQPGGTMNVTVFVDDPSDPQCLGGYGVGSSSAATGTCTPFHQTLGPPIGGTLDG
jgi:hypothetical protein